MSILASVQMRCAVKAFTIFSRSPMFLSLCLYGSKRHRNILVTKLTDFGDTQDIPLIYGNIRLWPLPIYYRYSQLSPKFSNFVTKEFPNIFGYEIN